MNFANALLRLAVLPALFLGACSDDPRQAADRSTDDPRATGPFPLTHRPDRLDAVGGTACLECHADEFADWSESHHAKANRRLDPSLDESAFIPARELVEGDAAFRFEWKDGQPMMTVTDPEGTREHVFEGVLAYEPLRQYLAPFPGGKWQVTTAAYDPAKQEWFDVFEGEDREKGEWGHWTGQGMNWNANCAYCHMTEFEKNLDPPTGNYHSVWTRQAISCIQCHTGMDEHVRTATPDRAGTLPRALSPIQVEASCASCHSRRDQLTAEDFRPGDSYHDHFDLSLPDNPGLYYADGQIRDEVFVYGSFRMSRMGHAGVTCMDCHDPHSMELTRPVHNNATCTWCHDGGLEGATVIEPLAHSHHPAESTGNRCVECHMPKTPYMQRDPRADHGFLSPDPRMTRELGIPNACNKCHEEESVEWAEKWVDEWYPDSEILNRQRERARALTAAWAGDPAAVGSLLALAKGESVHAWKATYTGLLGRFGSDRRVVAYLNESLDDPSSLVRARAATGLGSAGATGPRFDRLLDDPNRNVRIAAARTYANRGEPIPDASAGEEWEDYLLFNADRPQSALLLASRAIREGDPAQARVWIDRAIATEPSNPEVFRMAAVMFSQMGETARAARLLGDAYALAPDQAIFPYSLALIRAEEGNLADTIRLLRIAVRLEPEFYRAWYNLALALLRDGQPGEAAAALPNAAPGIDERTYREALNAIRRAARDTR